MEKKYFLINKAQIKTRIINFIAFFSMIIFSSEYLRINLQFFTFLNYFLLSIIILYLIDLKRVPRTSFLILLISSIFLCITAIIEVFDFSIFLKYLLIVFCLFSCSCERKIISLKNFKYFIYYPYITLLIIGIVQIVILYIFPSLLIIFRDLGMQGRPIGLSLEPTFYSQTLFLLFVLSKSFNFKGFKNPFLNKIFDISLIIILIACRTRTTILGGILYLFFSQKKINSSIIYLTGIFVFALSIIIERLKNHLISFLKQLNNLISISGEPREEALFYMFNKMLTSPFFGYGFNRYVHDTGLTVGSLYANFPIAAIYTLGIGSLPILYSMTNLIFISLKHCKKLPILLICIYLLPMPFLYTPFGLIALFISTYKIKYLENVLGLEKKLNLV